MGRPSSWSKESHLYLVSVYVSVFRKLVTTPALIYVYSAKALPQTYFFPLIADRFSQGGSITIRLYFSLTNDMGIMTYADLEKRETADQLCMCCKSQNWCVLRNVPHSNSILLKSDRRKELWLGMRNFLSNALMVRLWSAGLKIILPNTSTLRSESRVGKHHDREKLLQGCVPTFYPMSQINLYHCNS